MAGLLKSAAWPATGVICVWALYAAFCISRPAAAPPSRDASLEGGAPAKPATSRLSKAVRRARAPRNPEAAAAAAREVAEPPADPEEGAVAPDDIELLDLLARTEYSGLPEALATFVAGHPDHILARAMLALLLVQREDADPVEFRSHIEALRKLAPDKGLPDLLLVCLEARQGRRETAEGLLALAVKKDLEWLPDFEVMRLLIKHELEKGAGDLGTLRKLLSGIAPACMAFRSIAYALLPQEGDAREQPADALPVKVNPETARAVFEFGKAVQGAEGALIHNVVGAAVAELALKEIEKAGELTDEDRLHRQRVRDLQSLSSVFTDRMDEILLARPELMRSYLRGLAAHGEAAAARRTLMDYFVGELSR